MLPFITISNITHKQNFKALVDTGCQQTVISQQMCEREGLRPTGPRHIVTMLNGEQTMCCGEVLAEFSVNGIIVTSRCLVAAALVCDADVILGMDVIRYLGGVCIGSQSEVSWGHQHCAVGVISHANDRRIHIDDTDFTASFDGEIWTVEWKWLTDEPKLKNRGWEYPVKEELRAEFASEVEQWIADGWLEPYSVQRHGQVDGIIPLMAVEQPNKPKRVRPVMDYRELNGYVKSNPGLDTAVCQEKLRQ